MITGLEGKTALVTGAGAGIGRATALAFAEAGVNVLVADVRDADGEAVVAQIAERGGQARFAHADVAQRAAVKAAVTLATSTWGRLDCACNNAGIEGEMAPTAECCQENWERTLAVNLTGLYYSLQYELSAMLEGGGGAIVNMASVAGLVGFPNLPAYCASKGGVIQLTRAAALEYATHNIRINAVCPGAILTPMLERIMTEHPEMRAGLETMHPIGRLGRPEEIAAAVVWLCSDGASFITGQALAVDGGFTAQ